MRVREGGGGREGKIRLGTPARFPGPCGMPFVGNYTVRPWQRSYRVPFDVRVLVWACYMRRLQNPKAVSRLRKVLSLVAGHWVHGHCHWLSSLALRFTRSGSGIHLCFAERETAPRFQELQSDWLWQISGSAPGNRAGVPRRIFPSLPPPPSLTRMRTRKNYGWLARLSQR